MEGITRRIPVCHVVQMIVMKIQRPGSVSTVLYRPVVAVEIDVIHVEREGTSSFQTNRIPGVMNRAVVDGDRPEASRIAIKALENKIPAVCAVRGIGSAGMDI